MKNLITLAICCFTTLCFAQQPSGPYLLVSTQNAQIPLKETSTNVQISGTIAHVQTTQVYQNLGTEPIEAKYVFPLSTKAAVHKMQMTLGDRTINAKIFEQHEDMLDICKADKVISKFNDDKRTSFPKLF